MNVALSEVAAINPRLRATLRDEDTVHFLGMADVSEFGSTSEGDARPYGKVRKGYTPFEDGDLLVAKITPCFENGKIAQARLGSHIGFGSTEFHVVRVDDRVADARYILHLLRSPEVRLAGESQMTGSAGQKRVPKTFLEQLKIPLPPLPEQRRIAAILDQADTLRVLRRAALGELETLATSAYRATFATASTVTKPLSEIADVTSGITKGRRLNGSPVRDVPYMAVVNVQDRRLDLGTVKTIQATDAEIAKYALNMDDLLLTEGGDPDKLGRGVLWKAELAESIHQNHVFRVRLNTDEVLPLYLNWHIGSEYGKSYFLRMAKQTTGIASINSTQLKAFPVQIPAKSLQTEFRERMEELDASTAAMRRGLTELDTLFASLQHRAFRGEL
ncbi:restriction endonuclease subunit S [Agromyces larvae]|uniref:Restriction endonuclease subunit S n=1 Tax=Agromyces larvae TaxID=2929802 RepID=A0ABY4BZI4_9MICO|nr:restriction endonuclease subunit S [Agromyces larvae]UOE44159.1 restriction endonuclease subunit S [Agromyces larvae]